MRLSCNAAWAAEYERVGLGHKNTSPGGASWHCLIFRDVQVEILFGAHDLAFISADMMCSWCFDNSRAGRGCHLSLQCNAKVNACRESLQWVGSLLLEQPQQNGGEWPNSLDLQIAVDAAPEVVSKELVHENCNDCLTCGV